MNPNNVNAAAQRVHMAVEQVKATEKKARAAKEKVWRAKLLFKLARRAAKKAKKAAKRARAKAVQAQITLKELTEQITPPTRLSVRTGRSAPRPTRRAPNQSSTTAAQKQQPAGVSKVGVKPLRASARRRRPLQTRSAAKTLSAEADARSTKRRPQALETAEPAGVESVSTQPGAVDESQWGTKKPTGLGVFGEDGIRPH